MISTVTVLKPVSFCTVYVPSLYAAASGSAGLVSASAGAGSAGASPSPEAWASSSATASWTAVEETVTPEMASTDCFATIWSAQPLRWSSVSRSLAPSEVTAALATLPPSTVISTVTVLKPVSF